ncbi:hypothetical protein B0H19DRAFT_1065161 [Mycena capillaripes]|nr:hypothetical protein B0H19DRAFT_1065161 [Mycena capillaripes]
MPPIQSMGLKFEAQRPPGVESGIPICCAGPTELARLSGIWDSTHSPANTQSLINGVAGWLVFGLVGDACAKEIHWIPAFISPKSGRWPVPQSKIRWVATLYSYSKKSRSIVSDLLGDRFVALNKTGGVVVCNVRDLCHLKYKFTAGVRCKDSRETSFIARSVALEFRLRIKTYIS